MEMATHSSTLAWKIPWTEEPGRLLSMGSQRVGHNWVTSLFFMTWVEKIKEKFCVYVWCCSSICCYCCYVYRIPFWYLCASGHFFDFEENKCFATPHSYHIWCLNKLYLNLCIYILGLFVYTITHKNYLYFLKRDVIIIY